MRAIVLDTETTGFSPQYDRVTEVCAIDYDSGEVLMHTYVNPGIPISAEITRITGISDETVKDAPKFLDIAGNLAGHISHSAAMIGHNPWFDRSMLSAEFLRTVGGVTFPRLVCTKRTWDQHEPKEERHLSNAYKRFVNREGFANGHTALADTRATREVMLAQRKEFGLENLSWEEMDPEQTKWCGPSNHVIIVDGVLVFNVGKNKGMPCHAIEKSFWGWLVTKDFPDHVKQLADYLMLVKPDCTAEELYGFAYGRWG